MKKKIKEMIRENSKIATPELNFCDKSDKASMTYKTEHIFFWFKSSITWNEFFNTSKKYK